MKNKQNKKGLKTVEHFVMNGNSKPLHLTHIKSRYELAILQLAVTRQFALANPMIVEDGFDLSIDHNQRESHPTDKNVLNVPLRDNYCLLIGVKVLSNKGELHWVLDGVIGNIKANKTLQTQHYSSSMFSSVRRYLHLALGMDSNAVLEGKCSVARIDEKDEEIQPLFVRWIVPVITGEKENAD